MADFKEIFNKFNDTPDTTGQFAHDDIEKNQVMAILAYCFWLVLFPIICAKDSKFARYHANQGLVLAVFETVAGLILGIFGGIPLIGWIFRLARGLVFIVCILLAVIGVLNAANGKAKEVPFIGKIRLLK